MEREKAQDGCWASLILRDGQRERIPRRIRQKSGRERPGRATHRNQRGGVTSELGSDQRADILQGPQEVTEQTLGVLYSKAALMFWKLGCDL